MTGISNKESLRRRIAGAVLREAWKLLRRMKGYTWSIILRLAWKVVQCRTRLQYTKAVGVSISGTARQERLHKLLQYPTEQVMLKLVREHDNRFDSNAIRILGSIDGVTGFKLGYLRASLAAQIAPLMDAGHLTVAIIDRVTGTGTKGLHGLNFRFAVI
jgi:hypothetical protein